MDLSRKPSTNISLDLLVGTLGCSCRVHVLIAPCWWCNWMVLDPSGSRAW